MAEPVMIEYRADEFHAWVEEWYVEPPPLGVPFKVTRQEWDGGTRRIYEFELAPA